MGLTFEQREFVMAALEAADRSFGILIRTANMENNKERAEFCARQREIVKDAREVMRKAFDETT